MFGTGDIIMIKSCLGYQDNGTDRSTMIPLQLRVTEVDNDGNPTGKRVLMYWTAGRYSANHDMPTNKVYDHEVELFTYLPYQKVKDVLEEDEKTVKDQEIILALTDECKKYLIYRAISIFLISKKESEPLRLME